MTAPSTASSPTLMSSILLPMTTCLKDQNCFKPQDSKILKQISEPKEIGLYILVQTHIKIRCYEIRICHDASRGQCVRTPLWRNFTRFWVRNVCLGVNKVWFCARSTKSLSCDPDHLQHLRRTWFAGCRPLTSSRLLPIVECDDIKLQSACAKRFHSETQNKVLVVVSVDQVANTLTLTSSYKNLGEKLITELFFNFQKPNVNYSWRTAPLISKVAFYTLIQQI